eukprot:11166748-Lingulodinium_polyedra.AAC.1
MADRANLPPDSRPNPSRITVRAPSIGCGKTRRSSRGANHAPTRCDTLTATQRGQPRNCATVLTVLARRRP